jgi:TrwC relaxase
MGERAAVHHGVSARFRFDVAAPKSVSLLRALSDDIGEKTMLAAHQKGIDAATTYLHEHAGYTRVHNPVTGRKDLHRLLGSVGIAYKNDAGGFGGSTQPSVVAGLVVVLACDFAR